MRQEQAPGHSTTETSASLSTHMDAAAARCRRSVFNEVYGEVHPDACRPTGQRAGLIAALALLLAALSAGAETPAKSITDTTDAYLNSVWAEDWETMASFLTPDSIYRDFMMEYFGNGPIDLKGRDAIVAFYREANESTKVIEVRNKIRNRFVAAGNVVYELDTFVRADGERWGLPGSELQASFRVITFVQVRDGKISRQIDFSDYEDAMSQVQAQVEAHTPKE